ncbi:site-specific DNA-methyltransferase [Bartonella grahamii]|uniref:site-specific DNA-methyltransferase (adenine-specific) n=2 Tax=Bartonella grahamii TaxID=33045 RepID=A0A336NI62_BARGR|nr:site-specific DNA-methyltransferase [Bartonella grahamii]ACS51329.1 adenine specific DNA methylase Mod [Bartonella grahamii as4aup]SSZ40784.1 Modification methylase MboII [Bartonella grahamii]
MSYNKQKLELNWIGKEKRPKLEPRILLEDLEKSYHASHQISSQDIFDNKLIFGDNLLTLKALEQEYMGKVKCIYIDPPYNTGNAFEHYEDGLEHSLWLSLMRDRLELLHHLLADDGSIWISIDDDEQAYLKVMMDEIFGRQNFINNIIWQKKYAPQNDTKWLSDNHDFIMVYAKDKMFWRPQLLPRSSDMDARYKNPDNDPRGPWKSGDLSVKRVTLKDIYEIITPSGRKVMPPNGRSWAMNEKKFFELLKDNRIWFGPTGSNVPSLKRFLSEVKNGTVSMTIWPYTEVGHNQDAKKEVKVFNSDNVFTTPKPERLMERIIQLATNPGDLILDSFAGSGTTGAVAHKMGRKWIMIELGEHCHTHIIPRLKQVIDGTDQGGISKSVNWQGGGGFRYYRLAPSLLQKDPWGQWIISREYNAAMLSEAMCKHMGFTYAPDENHYWMQGYSTETDYIYVTTSAMTHEQLRIMSEEVGSHRTLLICGTAFDTKSASFENLTLTKIPRAVLEKCEWGRDDYSLNVANLEPVIVVKENNKNKDIVQAELDLFE